MATKLPGDPGHHGDYGSPVPPDPFQHIIAVHWGGANIVVVEIPNHLTFLRSLDPEDAEDPDDPNPELQGSGGGYNIGETIPEQDFRLSLQTTANIYRESVRVDTLANTTGLEIETEYDITGTNIPGDTTVTFDGGAVGTLSNAATADRVGAQVTIETRNWLFPPLAVDMESHGRINEFFTFVDSGPVPPYFIDPSLAFTPQTEDEDHNPIPQGDREQQCLDYFAERMALGFPAEAFLVFLAAPFPQYYNGAGPLFSGNTGTAVFQVMFAFRQDSYSALINFDATTLVSIKQIARGGDRGDGRIIPGYPTGDAVIIKAFGVGLNLSFDSDWHIQALDRVGHPVEPIWHAEFDLRMPVDDLTQEICRFNEDGIVETEEEEIS